MTKYADYFPTAHEIDITGSMIKVYNHMASGVLISGATAWLIAQDPELIKTLFHTWLMWPVILMPLAFVLAMSFGAHAFSAATLGVLFYLYSISNGAALSLLFAVYTGGSVATAFFVSAALFGSMSIYGYTTGRSLESFGQFLFIGLIGIMIAGIVNIFLHNSMLQMVISSLAVLIFVGLTAYDTQVIKDGFYENSEDPGKAEVLGALTLYLDFINIFVNLLQLIGVKKD
jgi:hypothetical protein